MLWNPQVRWTLINTGLRGHNDVVTNILIRNGQDFIAQMHCGIRKQFVGRILVHFFAFSFLRLQVLNEDKGFVKR